MYTIFPKGITVTVFSCGLWLASACSSSNTGERLPILGEREVVHKIIDGNKVTDTLYHIIPDFELLDQDSTVVSKKSLQGKIYLADFFFTRCPTICPITARNLLQIARHFEHDPRVVFLSHTVDPMYDRPYVLKRYATELGAPKNWFFLNGPKNEVYPLAGAEGYFSFAQENKDAPGGFDHSGAFSLVDTRFHVRAVYDGTQMDSIPKIIADIQLLLDKG
ncbi:SCO family protein [Sphingobacterium thalpophilum]|uniref:BsSco n=1 Tax=Sphingobacterium thalpophilum TaxID=259 RepID=A0A4U9UN00_9SPHI|nr:SCO family protein [Sphingobacterium thalpophilum]VTR33569.1 BsSco [Sphingobacterium thalpophilum]